MQFLDKKIDEDLPVISEAEVPVISDGQEPSPRALLMGAPCGAKVVDIGNEQLRILYGAALQKAIDNGAKVLRDAPTNQTVYKLAGGGEAPIYVDPRPVEGIDP